MARLLSSNELAGVEGSEGAGLFDERLGDVGRVDAAGRRQHRCPLPGDLGGQIDQLAAQEQSERSQADGWSSLAPRSARSGSASVTTEVNQRIRGPPGSRQGTRRGSYTAGSYTAGLVHGGARTGGARTRRGSYTAGSYTAGSYTAGSYRAGLVHGGLVRGSARITPGAAPRGGDASLGVDKLPV